MVVGGGWTISSSPARQSCACGNSHDQGDVWHKGTRLMLEHIVASCTWWWYSFIHLAVCLTTGPKPLPKRALHIVRSRASSFKWEYPLLFLRSSNSFVRLLPCLPVTSIPPYIFPSMTRCRRQFLCKMWCNTNILIKIWIFDINSLLKLG